MCYYKLFLTFVWNMFEIAYWSDGRLHTRTGLTIDPIFGDCTESGVINRLRFNDGNIGSIDNFLFLELSLA